MLRIVWLFFLLIGCSSDSNEKSGKKNTTKESKGAKSEKKANGLVKSYSSDGKLYSAINYKEGVKDGVSYSYYMNGQINLELTYVNGKREGQSKRYYENGQLYQTTEYKKDKMHGSQKKYRENSALISEAKFEQDEPCIGLKEYLLDGSQKKNFPAIVITPVDELVTRGRYTLRISMSDGTKKVKYFIGNLTPSGCLHNALEYVRLNEKNGVGEIVYTLPPGGFLMKELNIVAKLRTIQGNNYIAQKKYNLSLDN